MQYVVVEDGHWVAVFNTEEDAELFIEDCAPNLTCRAVKINGFDELLFDTLN